ncbi:hypothetical protein IMY05_019G0059500 [Salix suchowensis]|nr:hypothetical protein IMY05_019G0059500 [Salix suchowensis]
MSVADPKRIKNMFVKRKQQTERKRKELKQRIPFLSFPFVLNPLIRDSIWKVIHFISICSFYEFQTLTSISCLSVVFCFSGVEFDHHLLALYFI